MQLYTQRKYEIRKRSVRLFKKEEYTVYGLRIRLEMEPFEKEAFYEAKLYTKAAVIYHDLNGDETATPCMELVEEAFTDVWVSSTKRVLNLEEQLQETLDGLKQYISIHLGYEVEAEFLQSEE